MDKYERVQEYLNRLGLSVTEEILYNYLESAKDRSFMEMLDHLLEQEVKNLKSKKVKMKLNCSGLPFRKTMNDFDFTFEPSIDRSVIDDLITLRFIHNRENVVFLGPLDVGKTHLSVALGMNAANSEMSIYYTTAVKFVQILKKDSLSSRLSYRLATYSRFPLMIVDEIDYLPLTREESSLFFQFGSSWYERHSPYTHQTRVLASG